MKSCFWWMSELNWNDTSNMLNFLLLWYRFVSRGGVESFLKLFGTNGFSHFSCNHFRNFYVHVSYWDEFSVRVGWNFSNDCWRFDTINRSTQTIWRNFLFESLLRSDRYKTVLGAGSFLLSNYIGACDIVQGLGGQVRIDFRIHCGHFIRSNCFKEKTVSAAIISNNLLP